MKSFMQRLVFWIGSVILAVCLLSGPAFAGAVQGFPRNVRVLVETRYKRPLAELVRSSFEADGYSVLRQTDVELIVERPLPSSLRHVLMRLKGIYWIPADPVRFGITPSVERVAMFIVRERPDAVAVEGHRILVMSPGTVFEGAVADESRKRAEDLRLFLEDIRAESEAAEDARRREDPYFLLLSPDMPNIR